MTSTSGTLFARTGRPRLLIRTAACVAVVAGVAVAPVGPAVAAEADRHVGACRYDPAHLPRTADAIEGWFAQCRDRQNAAASAARPATADAIDGWRGHERA